MDAVLKLHVNKVNVRRPNYREIILRKSNSDGKTTTQGDILIIIWRHQSGTATLIIHVYEYII